MKVFISEIDKEKSIFDYEKINSLFDFYLITNEKENFTTASKIFDEPLVEPNILAIQYTSGKSFIIMMKKANTNEFAVSEILKKFNKEYDGCLSKRKIASPFEKYPHSLISIMLNALAKSKKDDSVSNISGKLYYFAGKKSNQILCVEARVNSSYGIELKSKTFTCASKETRMKEYILQPNNTLKLKTTEKTKSVYTDFQFKDKKNSVTFVNAASVDLFEKSKAGILEKVLGKFNTEYEGIANLVLKTEEDWEKLEVKSSSSLKTEHLRNLKHILSGTTIRIVDKINDSESELFCENLKTLYENLFSDERYFTKENRTQTFHIKISKSVSGSDLNLVLVHNKAYYENHSEEKDPYKSEKKIICQHLTIEDYTRNKDGSLSEAVGIVLLNELVVKKDLMSREKKITIFDWKKLGYTKDWIFCHCFENEKKVKEYYFMTVHPDGSFEIGKREKDLFNQKEYGKIEEIFEMNNIHAEIHNKYNEKYIGLVMDPDGNINIIQNTRLFMLPNSRKISEALEKGKISRTKEDLIEYFNACLDIYFKIDSQNLKYSVGQVGAGMKTSIERAARIRNVVPYENSRLFYMDLMQTMNVSFIRNGQLTVLPFPFKYLREFKNIAER